MPNINKVERVGVTLATANAVEQTAATFATRTDEAYQVRASVIAVATDAYDEVGGYVLHGTFKNDGGTLTLIGAVTADHTAEDIAGWNATLAASGTSIQCNVTGAGTTPITWRVDMDVLAVGWRSVQALNAP